MKKYIRATRYYVTDSDLIPLRGQPDEGYTKLQAINRAQREVEECAKLFGGKPEEYVSEVHIVDTNYNYCVELDSAI